jgi:hypothetical protein
MPDFGCQDVFDLLLYRRINESMEFDVEGYIFLSNPAK